MKTTPRLSPGMERASGEMLAALAQHEQAAANLERAASYVEHAFDIEHGHAGDREQLVAFARSLAGSTVRIASVNSRLAAKLAGAT